MTCDARYQMALASTYAGTGFGNAGTHLPHANAYPIAGAVENYRAEGYPRDADGAARSGRLRRPPPPVFRWTYPGDPGAAPARRRAAQSGQTFTKTDGADALAHVLSELMADIGMPAGLRTLRLRARRSRRSSWTAR